jgi:2-hydroxy-6-oxonona-2,4-dienedioate hydrolase
MSLKKGKLQSQYTPVYGVEMHARVSVDTVPDDAPPVILVHGLVVSSRYMIPTARLLAPYCRVYVPDLPGYGKSGAPDHVLDLSELADVLCRWMDAVGIKRASMLGNSFGCQIIAEFAMRYPERVDRVIFAGPTMDRHRRTLPQQTARLLWDSRLEGIGLGPIHLIDYWSAGLWRAIRTIQIALDDAIEEKLPKMAMPTLVVRGSRDPLVPEDWAREVVDLLPDGRLAVIPGGAHTTNYSTPLELSRITRAFLGLER